MERIAFEFVIFFKLCCFTAIWHTELDKDTDNGEFEFKGFYGDYELEITTGDRTVTKQISLKKRDFSDYKITL